MRTSFIIIISILIISCQRDDDSICYPEEIELTNILELNNCPDDEPFLTSVDSLYYLIYNQLEFDTYVTSECEIEIDFSRYMLLVGRSMNKPVNFRLTKECENNNYTLFINTSENGVQNEGYVYCLMVLKEDINDEINLEVRTL